MSDRHDPHVITLVYDAEDNRCRVDIGDIPPLVAAGWLRDAADQIEDLTLEPEFVVVIDGVEQEPVLEPDEE